MNCVPRQQEVKDKLTSRRVQLYRVRQQNITRNMNTSAEISKDIADSTHLPNFEILPYMQKDVREIIIRTKL